MKNSIFFILFCVFISCSSSNFENKYVEVKVDEWPDDYLAAVSLSFDDNNWTLKQCQQIFDKYNYKCTFFINPGCWMSKPLLEDIKNAYKAGFEIGNHGSTHKRLDGKCTLDMLNKEIVYSKMELKAITNQEFVYSFATPFGYIDSRSSSIISNNYVFVRNFIQLGRNIYHAPIEKFLINAKKNIDSLVLSKSFIILGGHGLDNCGYNPIRSEVLDSILSYLKYKNIWVDTFKNISTYYLIRENLKISCSTNSVNFNIDNSLVQKLKSMDINSLEVSLNVISACKLTFRGIDAKMLLKDSKYYYKMKIDVMNCKSINYMVDEEL